MDRACGTDAFIQQCCRIATNPRRKSHRIVKPPQPFLRGLLAAAKDLNIEIADFLAQGVAVDAEQVSGADLVAAGRRQGGREQRVLHVTQNPVVEAGRRQAVVETGALGDKIQLDGGGAALVRTALLLERG